MPVDIGCLKLYMGPTTLGGPGPNKRMQATRLRRDDAANGWEVTLRVVEGVEQEPPRGSAPPLCRLALTAPNSDFRRANSGSYWRGAVRFGETMAWTAVSRISFQVLRSIFQPARCFGIETYRTRSLSSFASRCRRGPVIRKRAI